MNLNYKDVAKLEIDCRYESNNFNNSEGPNFSEYKEEIEEISIVGLKRKYPEIENDIEEELDELNDEIQRTKNFLIKLQKRSKNRVRTKYV